MRSRSLRIRVAAVLTAALTSCVTGTTAQALQFERVPIDLSAILIMARGPIIRGDVPRLANFIASLPPSDRIIGLAVDSPGGNIVEASKLADLIRKTGLAVLVGQDSECSSACFLLFAAAEHRFVAPDALIGVHSASEDGAETVGSMASTTAMAREAAAFDVPPSIIGKLVETPPNRATWLTPADLAAMGAVTIDPPTEAAATPAPVISSTPEYYGALSPPAPAAAAPPAASPEFAAGLVDRRAWEAWFGGLAGPFKDGAEYWSGQRSLPRPGSCYGPNGQNLGDWTLGCLAAKRMLAPSDARRNSEPEYRAGWNSY